MKEAYRQKLVPRDKSAPSLRDPMNPGTKYDKEMTYNREMVNHFGQERLNKRERDIRHFVEKVTGNRHSTGTPSSTNNT